LASGTNAGDKSRGHMTIIWSFGDVVATKLWLTYYRCC